jgi:hypothetical protein
MKLKNKRKKKIKKKTKKKIKKKKYFLYEKIIIFI